MWALKELTKLHLSKTGHDLHKQKVSFLGIHLGSFSIPGNFIAEPTWINKTVFSLYEDSFKINGEGRVLLSVGKIHVLLTDTLHGSSNLLLVTTLSLNIALLRTMTHLWHHRQIDNKVCFFKHGTTYLVNSWFLEEGILPNGRQVT